MESSNQQNYQSKRNHIFVQDPAEVTTKLNQLESEIQSLYNSSNRLKNSLSASSSPKAIQSIQSNSSQNDAKVRYLNSLLLEQAQKHQNEKEEMIQRHEDLLNAQKQKRKLLQTKVQLLLKENQRLSQENSQLRQFKETEQIRILKAKYEQKVQQIQIMNQELDNARNKILQTNSPSQAEGSPEFFPLTQKKRNFYQNINEPKQKNPNNRTVSFAQNTLEYSQDYSSSSDLDKFESKMKATAQRIDSLESQLKRTNRQYKTLTKSIKDTKSHARVVQDSARAKLSKSQVSKSNKERPLGLNRSATVKKLKRHQGP